MVVITIYKLVVARIMYEKSISPLRRRLRHLAPSLIILGGVLHIIIR